MSFFFFHINRTRVVKIEARRGPGHTADNMPKSLPKWQQNLLLLPKWTPIPVLPPPPPRPHHAQHWVLVRWASFSPAKCCDPAAWGCFRFCQITYQGQVYPARRALCMTGSLSICVFYVSLVLPSDHTRSSSALFYVKVSSPRALGLQCILNPGHGGAHSRSSLCKDKGACKPLPSLAPFSPQWLGSDRCSQCQTRCVCVVKPGLVCYCFFK